MDYRWLLFLHFGAVLVFMLAHGVQVMVTWKKRWEADPAQNLALFGPLPAEQAAEAALAAAGTAGAAEATRAFDRARHSRLVSAMTAVGVGGVALILWLMIFKPF